MDDANCIALHVYYKFHFRVTRLKRAEFKRMLWLLFKYKVVSSFPASQNDGVCQSERKLFTDSFVV